MNETNAPLVAGNSNPQPHSTDDESAIQQQGTDDEAVLVAGNNPPQTRAADATAIRLFDDRASADRSIDALRDAAFIDDQMGLIAAPTDVGLSQAEARTYAQEIRKGRVLLIVHGDRLDDAIRIMEQHGGRPSA